MGNNPILEHVGKSLFTRLSRRYLNVGHWMTRFPDRGVATYRCSKRTEYKDTTVRYSTLNNSNSSCEAS